MKELFDKYVQTTRNSSSTIFKISDFKSTKLPIILLGEKNVFDTLREYEKARGYISIQNDTVALTSKGLLKARETRKDWD
jgi:hypothetical protein